MQEFPPASRRLRLGMVGGGEGALIGEVHANGARLSNRWEVVAGALSSDPDRARRSGQAWLLDDARVYTDYRAMAEQERKRSDGIDAVAIVTPNHLHAPVARAFMENGIDIISDKPLTAGLDEVPGLISAWQNSAVIYAVTYAYTAHVMVRQAREMIQRGDIGEIRQLHVEYFQDWAIDVTDDGKDQNQLAWRFDKARSGKSLTVADIGTHAAHMLSFVSGLDIRALRAEFHVTGAPKQLEDTAFMHLRMSGEIPATLMVSQAMAGEQCGLRFRVCGSRASLVWDQENPEYLEFRQIGEPVQTLSRGHGAGMVPALEKLLRMPRGHGEALTDAWANLYLELAVAIEARRNGRQIPAGMLGYPSLADGARGMQFVDAAIRSNRDSSWVELDEPLIRPSVP